MGWLDARFWLGPVAALVWCVVLGCGAPVGSGLGVGHAQAPAPARVERDPKPSMRAESFEARLSAAAQALVLAQGGRERWVESGSLAIDVARCAEAIGEPVAPGASCTLFALGEGGAAVLALSAAADGCTEDGCLERSWVFLAGYRAPLPLPPRHRAEYRALRADLPSARAESLWLAGFRGYGDARVAAGEGGEGEPPRLAEYRSCALAPDARELLCRTLDGDVLALDPAHGRARIVAALGLAAREVVAGSEPVFWMPDGQLAARVQVLRHPLCGGESCALIGLVPWPSAPPHAARLVRAR